MYDFYVPSKGCIIQLSDFLFVRVGSLTWLRIFFNPVHCILDAYPCAGRWMEVTACPWREDTLMGGREKQIIVIWDKCWNRHEKAWMWRMSSMHIHISTDSRRMNEPSQTPSLKQFSSQGHACCSRTLCSTYSPPPFRLEANPRQYIIGWAFIDIWRVREYTGKINYTWGVGKEGAMEKQHSRTEGVSSSFRWKGWDPTITALY